MTSAYDLPSWPGAWSACLQMCRTRGAISYSAHSCGHSSSCRLHSWRVLKVLVCIAQFRILQHVDLSLTVLI